MNWHLKFWVCLVHTQTILHLLMNTPLPLHSYKSIQQQNQIHKEKAELIVCFPIHVHPRYMIFSYPC